MSRWEREELLSEVCKVLRGPCGVTEPIRWDRRLVEDLGLDSVGFLALAVGLENRFRVNLEEDPERPPYTVAELVDLLQERLSEAGS